MATAPNVYKGFTPAVNIGGFTPPQLAGLNFLLKGDPAPFEVNTDFLAAARVFASSEIQTPLDYDILTGKSKSPDLLRDVSGIAYYVRGDDVYLYRKAQDCGIDENRYEEVWIGKTYDIAKGTYAYYGNRVENGTFGTGSGYVDNNGDWQSPGNGAGPSGPGSGGSPAGTNADGSVGGSTTAVGAPSATAC